MLASVKFENAIMIKLDYQYIACGCLISIVFNKRMNQGSLVNIGFISQLVFRVDIVNNDINSQRLVVKATFSKRCVETRRHKLNFRGSVLLQVVLVHVVDEDDKCTIRSTEC